MQFAVLYLAMGWILQPVRMEAQMEWSLVDGVVTVVEVIVQKLVDLITCCAEPFDSLRFCAQKALIVCSSRGRKNIFNLLSKVLDTCRSKSTAISFITAFSEQTKDWIES